MRLSVCLCHDQGQPFTRSPDPDDHDDDVAAAGSTMSLLVCSKNGVLSREDILFPFAFPMSCSLLFPFFSLLPYTSDSDEYTHTNGLSGLGTRKKKSRQSERGGGHR